MTAASLHTLSKILGRSITVVCGWPSTLKHSLRRNVRIASKRHCLLGQEKMIGRILLRVAILWVKRGSNLVSHWQPIWQRFWEQMSDFSYFVTKEVENYKGKRCIWNRWEIFCRDTTRIWMQWCKSAVQIISHYASIATRDTGRVPSTHPRV